MVPGVGLPSANSEKEKIPNEKPESCLSLNKIRINIVGRYSVGLNGSEKHCSTPKSDLSEGCKAGPLQCLSKVVWSRDEREESSVRDSVAGFPRRSQTPQDGVGVDVDRHAKEEEEEAEPAQGLDQC